MWLYDRPIAHRGLHDNANTENSMGAFRNAIEKGYNIETDVHILKSGEVVIFHFSLTANTFLFFPNFWKLPKGKREFCWK